MSASFTDGWLVQSSARIASDGRALSTEPIDRSLFFETSLPATVLGTLIDHGVYEDPFVGDNWKKLPGLGPLHENFSNHPMPEDSPFRLPWWFIKEFQLAATEQQTWLEFEGINYRANVWLNGTLVADSSLIAGAYREHALLVTDALRDGTNRLAIEVFAPEPNDLGITWVDWNPSPPDKNMGLFRPAALRHTGAVALRHPQLVAKFPGAHAQLCELELYATVENTSNEPRSGTLSGELEGHRFEIAFELGPRETRELVVTAAETEALRLQRPRLWWPRQLGEQPLYRVDLELFSRGTLCDRSSITFGVREVTSEFDAHGSALFRINGKPILIRGGGWASDVFLRSNPERTLCEYEYVKDLNLNAIRFEGMLERRDFLERCDRDGVLVIAGFCCCDHWEKWENWKDEDLPIAVESLRSQIRRARNHPCLIAWWYGSDNPPPRHVEERYLEVLDQERWPNPAHSSAAHKTSELTGPSGLKMAGPYDYVPPNYWLTDKTRGGAFGFATEISPGPAIVPLESLRSMLGESLWPQDERWNLHAGGGPFKDLTIFNQALDARYGKARDLDDYLKKAQLMTYEAERAMFEGFTREKYRATGVIQWMLNNAWPSLIWHLWDWYLRPGGGYYGVKKACEPLHVQYSYDDRSVVIVNERSESISELVVEARLLNLDTRQIFFAAERLDVGPDSVTRVLSVPAPDELDKTHFLHLSLTSPSAERLSTNVYWLSTAEDRFEDKPELWYTSPLVAHADLSGLAELAPARVVARCALDRARRRVSVTLENPGPGLAFFLRLRLLSDGGAELLPVLWEDNFVTLLPHEVRSLQAHFPLALHSAPLTLELSGWNSPGVMVRFSS